jgi:hypothetical protein
LSRRSITRFFALGIAAIGAAAITAYAAADVAAYVAQARIVGPAQAVVTATEPQISNRPAKADRVALLLDSPSYTNFNPSLLAVALSSTGLASNRGSNVVAASNGLLNDAQIAGIESRLRLTPQQAQHWPAVATALRELGRRYFQARRPQNTARKIDVNSPEVQRLIATAVPLIQQLSEDQKREVRQLVRIIGLETVAAQI